VERIVLGPRRGLFVVNLIGALAFVVASVLVLAIGHSTKAILAGVMGIVFFGACSLAFIARLKDTAVIVLDDRGIHDRRLGALIGWDSILGAAVPRMIGGGAAVALELRNAEEILSRCRPLYRRLAAANKALGIDPIAINLTGLEADAQTLADLITKEVAQRRPRDGTVERGAT
jgi:hypothetical protein